MEVAPKVRRVLVDNSGLEAREIATLIEPCEVVVERELAPDLRQSL